MQMTTRRWILLGVAVFLVMLMCAGGIGALVWGGWSLVADSEAFHVAEAHAKASPEVQARVGAVSAIEVDWTGGTSVNQNSVNGVTSGNARYSLRIHGAKGDVAACALLHVANEKWQVDDFVVGQNCSGAGGEANVEPDDPV